MLARWLSRDEMRIVEARPGPASTFIVREDRRFRELVEIGESEMVHTRVHVAEPLRSGFAYTDAMHASAYLADRGNAPAARSGPLTVLCLGTGGGVIARQLVALGADVDAIDASADALDLAATYFDLHEGPTLRLHRVDAAEFLAHAPPLHYDLAMVDLFGAFTAPKNLADPRFFESLRETIARGGAIAVNTVGALDGSSGVMHAVRTAMDQAFGESVSVAMLTVRERATHTVSTNALRNHVLFATHGPLPPCVAERRPSPAWLTERDIACDDLDVCLRAVSATRRETTLGSPLTFRRLRE